jgi:FlaA1/EpsC-like NDP-sugar epimerase
MRNRYVLIADLVLMALCVYGAFALRLGWFFGDYDRTFRLYLAATLLIKPVVFHGFDMYRRYWRYASVRELIATVLAVSSSSLVMAIVVVTALMTAVVPQFPRSVLFMDWLLTLTAVGGIRMAVRVFAESEGKAPALPGSGVKQVLIVGAGDAGAMAAREMQRNPQLRMTPVGFLDDDAVKIGKHIYGFKVLGPLASLGATVARHRVDEVIIAMPTASGSIVRAVSEACRLSSVAHQTMPGVFELLDGKASISRLRQIDITDLLRRDQTQIVDHAANYMVNRVALVTGAGGSIGFELCRQIAGAGPAQLVLLGHGENSIFDAAARVRAMFPSLHVSTVIADVRDYPRIARVFSEFAPDVVFHAAAHKHVPLMEENPEEAITNNVFGTRNVVEATLGLPNSRLVLISTDKAVAPSSMMGVSKRVAEQIVRNAAIQHHRGFVVVRFGNVLGSRGSVVPVFKRQIEQGGPVQVTHPDMKRFFMTIPEAVHLVLQAGGLGRGGELFVLKMGEPVKVVDLATDLIRLSGFEVADIGIVFTGVRPGEKLEERLFDSGATIETTDHPDVLRVVEQDGRTGEELASTLDGLVDRLAAGDVIGAQALLADHVPSYVPG